MDLFFDVMHFRISKGLERVVTFQDALLGDTSSTSHASVAHDSNSCNKLGGAVLDGFSVDGSIERIG